MEYQEIDCIGRFWVERVTSNPSWHSSYEGRLIYNSTAHKFYYGSNSAWSEIPTGDADNFLKSNAADSHSGTITPTVDNSINLGSGSKRYAVIYGVSFEGTTTTATYADMAEKYTTKEEYPLGTIMRVSNNEDYELEACDFYYMPVGVISKNPGFILNNEGEGQLIGLVGKLPVRINGPVRKGDIIIPDKNGCGKSIGQRPWELNNMNKVGMALETNMNKEEKLIICTIK